MSRVSRNFGGEASTGSLAASAALTGANPAALTGANPAALTSVAFTVTYTTDDPGYTADGSLVIADGDGAVTAALPGTVAEELAFFSAAVRTDVAAVRTQLIASQADLAEVRTQLIASQADIVALKTSLDYALARLRASQGQG